jgi:hypothetical protein
MRVKKAFHWVRSKLSVGPTGFFESRTNNESAVVAISTQALDAQ